MQKKILLLTFLISLSSCRWLEDSRLPFMSFMGVQVPNGSPIFKKGFRAGCKLFYSTRGNIFYRTFNSYEYDPKLHSNTEYRLGYQRGSAFCFNTINGSVGPNSGSFDRYILPTGNDPARMSAMDYNNTTSGMFSGIMNQTAGGNVDDVVGIWRGSINGDILWASGSKGQFFGQ